MSRWEDPGVVQGFATGVPNTRLLDFVRRELSRRPSARVLDVGCGAGRNAWPMAELGARVVGVDLARPMLLAARDARGPAVPLAAAAMDLLPFPDAAFDVVVAHGIWNLARSDAELRRGLAEAARVARPGAGLFVFAFSRATLPAAAPPIPGERLVFVTRDGEPQVYLRLEELAAELAQAGFDQEALTELDRPRPGTLLAAGPVFLEGTWRRRA